MKNVMAGKKEDSINISFQFPRSCRGLTAELDLETRPSELCRIPHSSSRRVKGKTCLPLTMGVAVTLVGIFS